MFQGIELCRAKRRVEKNRKFGESWKKILRKFLAESWFFKIIIEHKIFSNAENFRGFSKNLISRETFL